MDYNSVRTVVLQQKTIPVKYFSQQLLIAVKYANKGVQDNLFGGTAKAVFPNLDKIPTLKAKGDAAMKKLSSFAIYYASYVISTNSSNGFNKTIQNVSFKTITTQINNLSTQGTGMALFLDYMTASDKLGSAFSSSTTMQQSAEAIANNLGSTDAFNLLITQLQHGVSSASVFPAKVFLSILNVLDNGGSNFTKVKTAWSKSGYWNLVSDWNSIDWLATLSADYDQNAPDYTIVNNAVSAAINIHTSVGRTRTDCPPCSGGMVASCPTCEQVADGTTTTYGSGLLGWLNSATGPKLLGLRSGSGPDNVHSSGGSGGCLIKGTKLLKPDGSWIAIEDIKPGTRLMNGMKEEVVASFERVVTPNLDVVYGINDQPPMMSKEHAVMTQRGWCSLNPKATMALNPHIKVGYLTEGDVVWKIDTSESGDNNISLEVVRYINHIELPKGEEKVGYSFKFKEGNRSVWANGYCTLSNYPELTSEKIKNNVLGQMTAKEQMDLLEGLREVSPLFGKALGKSALNSLVQSITEENGASQSDSKPVAPNLDLDNLVLPKLISSINGTDANLDFSIIHGNLFINGQKTETHTKGDRLYWVRNNNEGKKEHGALLFSADRLSAHGTIKQGETESDISVYSEVPYDTSYGKTNTPWYQFKMGFKENAKKEKVMFGQLFDEKGKPFSTTAVKITFSPITKDKHILMQADIEFDPTWVAWNSGKWISATFLFTNDYRAFSGEVYEYNSNKPLNRGQGYALHGTYSTMSALLPQHAQLTDHFISSPIQTRALDTSVKELPEQKFATALALSTEHLSVEALYTLTPPDMVALHKTNFATLKNLMEYAVPDDMLKWFNTTRPGVGSGQKLTQGEADLIKNQEVDSFLKDKFALGYLSQAFSVAKDEKIKNYYKGVPDWKNKLAYFWQGNGTDCFGRAKGYNIATSKIMDNNYKAAIPGLRPYLNSDSAGWAKKLYEYCIQPSILNNLAVIDPSSGTEHLNNIVMMLHALDSKKIVSLKDGKKITYAASLYTEVLNVRLKTLSNRFTTGTSEKDMEDELNGFLRQYYKMARDGNPNWGEDTQKAAEEDLQKAFKKYEVDSINALEEHWSSIVTGMISILKESSKLPLTKRLADWADKNPGKASIFGAALTFATFSLATFTMIKVAINWKETSTAQKAKAITNVASGMASIFDKFAQYKNAQILAGIKPGDRLDAALGIDGAFKEIEMTPIARDVVATLPAGADDLATPLLSRVGSSGAGSISAAGSLEEGTALWTKVAKVSSKFAEGMGILALGVACWATGEQIYNDVESGQPVSIIALDILEEVANATSFVIAAGVGIAGLLSVEVASFIPVIGVVVAIIGIIVSLVLLFIHRNKPDTPSENFVKDTIVPWLNGLTSPPKSWLENRKKAQDHLNGQSSKSGTVTS